MASLPPSPTTDLCREGDGGLDLDDLGGGGLDLGELRQRHARKDELSEGGCGDEGSGEGR